MSEQKKSPDPQKDHEKPSADNKKPSKEIGGPPGPEPTRYGDWEKSGKCVDF